MSHEPGWSVPVGGQPGLFESAGPTPSHSLSSGDERFWGALAHLSIPFFGFVGPLIIWLVFKGRSAWLAESAREALNFSILYTIAMAVSAVLMAIMIGLLFAALVGIAGLTFGIVGALAAYRGEHYHYPVNPRFVR